MKITGCRTVRRPPGPAKQRSGLAAKLMKQLAAGREIVIHRLSAAGIGCLLRRRQGYLPDVELNPLVLQPTAEQLGLLTVRGHAGIDPVAVFRIEACSKTGS
ncbi:hypothetical protein D3C73_1425970 [compost metagenome]